MGIEVPDWREVEKFVRDEYGDIFPKVHRYGRHVVDADPCVWDGASDPLRFLYGYFYKLATVQIIDESSYGHDAGFSFLRLDGSPYSHITRKGWNKMYREAIHDRAVELGSKEGVRASKYHAVGLAIGSRKPWKSNRDKMTERGYTNLETWARIAQARLLEDS